MTIAAVAAALALSSCGPPPCRLAEAERPSIVLIVIDTLRADHLSHHGYEEDTSPNLSRLARTGTTFMKGVAATPWTGPSVCSIVSGKYPDELGVHELTDPLPPSAVTIAERLKELGYATGAVSSNGYISQWFGQEQGYDDFHYAEYTGEDDNATPVFTADRVTDRALEWLESAVDPFFLYVHYMDPHEPYLPPVDWSERFVTHPEALDERLLIHQRFAQVELSEAQFRVVQGLYDAEIAFVDHELRRLLDKLPEETLVVVVGDHGEEFLDHGGFLHGHTVYEELLHVPLIFSGPGVCGETTVDRSVSHVDIVPTILDLVGAPADGDLTGRSLRSYLERRSLEEEPRQLFSIREYEGVKYVAARSYPWKLIYSRQTGHTWLFHLEQDPREQQNVAPANPELTQELIDLIAARERGVVDAPPLDSEEMHQKRLETLRGLGYID